MAFATLGDHDRAALVAHAGEIGLHVRALDVPDDAARLPILAMHLRVRPDRHEA
jgi:hypothetical protein